MSVFDENRSPQEREDASRAIAAEPKPRRKQKKPRAPRVVKKREYRVFRIHGNRDIEDGNVIRGAAGLLIEEMPDRHPDQSAARQWIKDNAKDGETYMCAAVLFVATVAMEPQVKFE